ncbi:MAG: hypothetical protein APU95_05875 [Hadesarchaea archaeon YNP_N21]|nr:MAG: hypothetical protein APU95_05875 [Hadesarchaea archaeon YNP_N21]
MISLIYIAGIVLSFYMAWNLGANDAANPTDCAVGAGVVSLKRALILFAIFVALGAILQGFMVMKTIDRGIVPRIDIPGAFVITLSACIWITLCTWIGMPVSTTHSIVGAVFGYGILTYGIEGIEWEVSRMIFLSMLASPVLSSFLALGLYRAFVPIFGRMKEKTAAVTLKWVLIAGLCFSAYAFGSNDVANATGVYVTITREIGGMPDYSTMILLALMGSVGIALGGFTWGYKVINTAAKKITRLNPLTGLSAELANASAVYLFTTIPYILFGFGIPISTTHSSIGSIIGVGLAGGGGIDKKTVVKILATWALTLPATATISAVLNKVVMILIKG